MVELATHNPEFASLNPAEICDFSSLSLLRVMNINQFQWEYFIPDLSTSGCLAEQLEQTEYAPTK